MRVHLSQACFQLLYNEFRPVVLHHRLLGTSFTGVCRHLYRHLNGRLHYHSDSLRPVEIYLLTKHSVILELGMIAIIRGFRVIDGLSVRTAAETNSPPTGNEVRPDVLSSLWCEYA